MRFPAITGYRESKPLQLALTQGSYEARSVIASAQRCVNLYPEINPQDAPFPMTLYPVPGLGLWSGFASFSGLPTLPPSPGRGVYFSTRGQLFVARGGFLYYVNSAGAWSLLGPLSTMLGQVSMVDNGLTLLVADGPSTMQLEACPVSQVTPLAGQPAPAPIPWSWYSGGQAVTMPGWLEVGVDIGQNTEAGTTVDLLLQSGSGSSDLFSGDGYLLRLATAAGGYALQLFSLTNSNLTLIGTPTLIAAVQTVALPPGSHYMTLQVQQNTPGVNYFTAWLNGQPQLTATDSTYPTLGAVFVGSQQTTPVVSVGPAKLLKRSVYVVDLTTLMMREVVNSAIYGATHVDYVDTFFLLNSPQTQAFYITTSNLAAIDATEGPITELTLTAGGTGYANGTFSAVPLTGGLGSGATANLTTVGGIVTGATLVGAGAGYGVGDVLGATLAGLPAIGSVTSLAITRFGAGIVPGTYTAQPLFGGTGTGATATIVVTGNGNVGSVSLVAAGSGYTTGDLLSASLPLSPILTRYETSPRIEPQFTATTTGTPSTGSGLELTVGSIALINAVNALNIASKTGYADLLRALIVVHREIWLFGDQTTEVWMDVGAPFFPFALEGGVFLQRGIHAIQSLAKSDLTPFWLGKDQNGAIMAFQGVSYEPVRISTYPIEAVWQAYTRSDDAQGFVYQQGGHTFYVLNFPTADRTWVFDVAQHLWHERAGFDVQGNQHRWAPNGYARAYGQNLMQHGATGDLLYSSLDLYDVLGTPTTYIRSFPHIQNELRRLLYLHFTLSMEVGNPMAVNQIPPPSPTVNLRWSNDAGQTWSAYVAMPLPVNKYNAHLRWNRLGMARDRVFEVSWNAPMQTALNGAWTAFIESDS